ncbi:MAG: DUF3794 domain-containing protein [Acetanaerobacterium sp.]
MELMVNKEAVTINEVVYDGCVQQPVSCDLMLPDYCPDILRMLRCDIDAKVVSKQVIGAKLVIDGAACVRLLYIDDARCLRSHEHKIPFTTNIELKNASDNASVEAHATTDYVNCHPVSQRRLDIKGSLSVCAVVTAPHTEQVVSEAGGMNVEVRRKMMKLSRTTASVGRTFTVKEELEVGYGKASVAAVVRSVGACVVTDYKLIANKIILKAELSGHILYTGDDKASSVDILEYTLPISQIVDMEGVDEESQCRLMLTVNGITAEVRANNEGEARVLAISVEIGCNAMAYKSSEVPVVTDMYSTKFESTFTAKQVTFERLAAVLSNEYTVKNTYDMPEERIANVMDVWSEVAIKNAKVENGELVVMGAVKTCMLAMQEDGESTCFERSGEVEYRTRLENSTENMAVNSEATVKSTQYTISGKDKIEVRCTLFISASVFVSGRENVLTDIAVNDKVPKQAGETAALIIYFAEENESVWDIAKHYNTSANLIANSNELSGETMGERCMLLIPTAAVSDEN